MSATQKERFTKIYDQSKMGVGNALEIWVDRDTGVNYLYKREGSAGGLTVLVDGDGQPVISPVER